MRVTRSIPIHENIRMEFFAEAFNLVNHQNRLTVNTTAFSYAAPSAASTVCNSANHANACIYPSVVTGSAPFQATTSTSSLLYGPRQLQFSAKLFF
jgi:hypothetical protein